MYPELKLVLTMNIPSRCLAALSFACLFLSACGFNAVDTTKIDLFTHDFHENFNEEEYEAIYEKSAAGMKRGIEKDTFIGLMQAIQISLGQVKESNRVGMAPANSDQGESLIMVQFRTSYNNGIAHETFFLKEENGKLLLFQYNINSDTLLEAIINKR